MRLSVILEDNYIFELGPQGHYRLAASPINLLKKVTDALRWKLRPDTIRFMPVVEDALLRRVTANCHGLVDIADVAIFRCNGLKSMVELSVYDGLRILGQCAGFFSSYEGKDGYRIVCKSASLIVERLEEDMWVAHEVFSQDETFCEQYVAYHKILSFVKSL